MGAVAGATQRIAVGSLVARATLRPPAVLANGFDTLARVLGPERLLVAIGAGDGESQEENETFGLEFGTVADRVAARARRGRRGARPWLPGVGRWHRSRRCARSPAAHADGWNRWGGGLERFREQAANLHGGRGAPAVHGDLGWAGGHGRRRRRRRGEGRTARARATTCSSAAPSWSRAALRAYVEAGAEWLIIGPVDSSDPDNARILGEEILPRLR